MPAGHFPYNGQAILRQGPQASGLMNQFRAAQGRRHSEQVCHNFVSTPGGCILVEARPLFGSARPDQSIELGSGVAAAPVQRGPERLSSQLQPENLTLERHYWDRSLTPR